MFSIITIASSTTNPVEMVNAINVRLLRLYPSRYITPNVPISESGTATLGITVAERFRRNTNTTITTSAMASISSNSTSFTEARIVVVRSVRICTFTALGRAACNCGSSVLIRSTTLMMLAPGCRWILTITAGASFIQAAWRTFSASSLTIRHVGQLDWSAVPVRDDQRRVRRRAHELSVGQHGEAFLLPVERSGWKIDVGALNRSHHFVDAEAVRGKLSRVHVDADGIFLRTHHLHLRHAADH